MKNLFKSFLLINLSLLIVSFSFAQITSGEILLESQSNSNIDLTMEKNLLKELVDKYKFNNYYYSIRNSKYEYTKVDELKAEFLIRLIWSNDKEFIKKTFTNVCYDNDCKLQDYLRKVQMLPFGGSIGENILDSGFLGFLLGHSFKTNSYDNNKDSLYNAVYTRIESECFSRNGCPDVEQLNNLDIYLGNNQVKIGDVMFLFDYKQLSGNMEDKMIRNMFDLNYTTQYIDKETLSKIGKIFDFDFTQKYEQKDYKELLKNVKLGKIPEIYKKIPNDSVFVHVKSPKVLFELLNKSENIGNYSISFMKKAKDLFISKYGIKDENALVDSIKGEVLLILTDYDVLNPGLVLVLDQKDLAMLNISSDKAIIKVDNGKVYVSFSQSAIDKLFKLKEVDSIYNADDFKYSWSKQGDKFKDMFFFGGDKYFAKILDFEHYNKFYTKMSQYKNLRQLQYFLWIYNDIYGKQPSSLQDLTNLLQLTGIEVDDYKIKDSIIESGLIGNIFSMNNYQDVNIPNNLYSRDMVFAYMYNVQGYKQVWRAFLDPVSIVLNANSNGYDLDFLMTPIPEFDSQDLREISKFFQGYGVEKFDLWEDDRMRQGFVGLQLGLDFDKLITDISSGSGSSQIIKELVINNPILKDIDLKSYIGNEIYLGLGNLDFLNGYNLEKLDLFLAIEFKSFLKGQEFMGKIVKNIGSENSQLKSFVQSIIKDGLIKPLIQEYNGHNIYYIPTFDDITINYVILDKFVYISTSRDSIKKSIDYYNDKNQTSKSLFADKINLMNQKLFALYLDKSELLNTLNKDFAMNTKDNINNLYDIFEFYFDLKGQYYFSIINSYLNQYSISELSKQKLPVLNYEDKFVKITGEDKKIYISIQPDYVKLISENQDFFIDEASQQEPIYKSIINGDKILLNESENIDNKDVIEFITALDLLNMESIKDILTNFVFGFNLGTDEIQIVISNGGEKVISKGKDKQEGYIKPFVSKVSQDNFLYILGIGGPLLLFIVMIVYIFGVKKKDEFKD